MLNISTSAIRRQKINKTLPSCKCSQVAGDERTERQKDKETNGTKNGMSFNLEVEANEFTGRKLNNFCVNHLGRDSSTKASNV